MRRRLTIFTATLVQDSALSVSGIDRESSADQPFALVNGVPLLSGRGLKGAAVAMARRFFDPLPESISGDMDSASACRRSVWEFANATPEEGVRSSLRLRAGVGIRHKTGTRAGRVLYDREVVPAGTRWPLTFRVDWSYAPEDGGEAEGILAYVLARHWSAGRCWLGGSVARGLGWCHIENLRAFQLDSNEYDRWVESGRNFDALPDELSELPLVEPTRSWCFRTLDVKVSFGEYCSTVGEAGWGLDMLAIGPHDAERTSQASGDGLWAMPPSYLAANDVNPDALSTDRAILMEENRPLLPGSSIRGLLRYVFSRSKRIAGHVIQDPHGEVDSEDEGGKIFGTLEKSSHLLIRDGRAEEAWAAARLHMHAEDEFTAGSYGSAKRDAVRLLRGTFPIRIVVEGKDAGEVEPLVQEINRLVALGELGHLPVGGHRTRGAGWGRWQAETWSVEDIHAARSWSPEAAIKLSALAWRSDAASSDGNAWREWEKAEAVHVRVTNDFLNVQSLTLGEASAMAREKLREHCFIAWWCEPTIDLALTKAPVVFGRHWPDAEAILVDEVAFYAERAVWRVARTSLGIRSVFIEELRSSMHSPEVYKACVARIPARLHGNVRFATARIAQESVLLREWRVDDRSLGFTLEKC